MRRLLPAFLLLTASAAHAEKPAAVRVCFSGLGSSTPLFSEHPAPHYRDRGEGIRMLDFDLTLDGEPPAQITRASADCLRAWLPARPVHHLAIHFERTATNLLPSEEDLKLKLVADKWSDGGTLTVHRGADSAIATDLPGELVVTRLEAQGEARVAAPSHLPTGRYRVRYLPPPPPQLACPTALVVEAGGTIRTDNRPELVTELTEHYRRDILPGVLTSLHETCAPAETLEVRIEIWDGVFLHGATPEMKKTAVSSRLPRYALQGAGAPRPYVLGEPLEVGYGERLQLIQLSDDPALATR